jgi:HK97 gp10 family phage protein
MSRKATTTFAKIDKALTRISKHIEAGRLDQLVLDGAEQMLQIVKNQCPVDSGKLRNSLYIDIPGGRKAKGSWAENWKDNPKYEYAAQGSVYGVPGRQSHLSVENLYCRIATNVHYAWFVEFGTVDTPAQPFMRPAYDTAARPMIDTVRSAFTDLVIESFAQAL